MTSTKFTYHIHELSITGGVGCGKTTLIKKIIQNLSDQYKIFHFKEDDQKTMPFFEQKLLALDYDFAFVEGHQDSDIKKLVFIGDNINNIKNVLAFISPNPCDETLFGKPCFHRNEVDAIENFILETFLNEAKSFPLNALVLTGGKSSRMGQDKGQINYHGEAQTQYLAKLLENYCDHVFFSCRADQLKESHLQNYPQIHDNFLELGPVGGILSYFQKHPRTRLLVVACDMPFIDASSIEELINQCAPFKVATVFENPEKKWPEPLFAIYHPKSQTRFFQLLGAGYNCPMKMLFNSQIKKIIPTNSRAVLNGNTQEEMLELKNIIQEFF